MKDSRDPSAAIPVTIFATTKAFRGHFAVIQRNAITSWSRIAPKVGVILMGDSPGTAEICKELGLLHIRDVASNQSGAPRLDDLFAKAEDAVPEGLLCYVNADIMLTDDFSRAAQRVAGLSPLMMIGRRWDTDIAEPWDFQALDWQDRLRTTAHTQGKLAGAGAVDYFLFSKGLGRNLLPFAVGRPYWDHWMVWNALRHGATLVDASDLVMAVHQNHDYSHHPAGRPGVWDSEEAKKNRRLAGDSSRLLTIDDVRFRLTPEGLQPRYLHVWRTVRYSWRHPRAFVKFLGRSLIKLVAKRNAKA